jgi:hypothetical protein
MGVNGKLHAPAVLPPGKGLGAHLVGSWLGNRASLEGCGNAPPPGFDPWNVRTISISYKDQAVLAYSGTLKAFLFLHKIFIYFF